MDDCVCCVCSSVCADEQEMFESVRCEKMNGIIGLCVDDVSVRRNLT